MRWKTDERCRFKVVKGRKGREEMKEREETNAETGVG